MPSSIVIHPTSANTPMKSGMPGWLGGEAEKWEGVVVRVPLFAANFETHKSFVFAMKCYKAAVLVH